MYYVPRLLHSSLKTRAPQGLFRPSFTSTQGIRHRLEMSTKPPSLKRPIHWILDWDGTITQNDTLNALVNIAASSKPSFPTTSQWKSVVDAYISDYTSTLHSLTPNGTLPSTIEAERNLLQDLKPAEQRSLDRVFASQIFKDLTRPDIEDDAKKAIESGEISLRPGFLDFFHSISHQSSDVDVQNSTFHILSVNWSRHFISSCLLASSIHLNSSHILANELDGITEGRISSGEISPEENLKIISSGDKLRHLKAIREKAGGEGSVVYVGDSWPDIECLIDADVGICMRDEETGSSQRKLGEALERIGVVCLKLGEKGGMGKEGVRWARDFVEIRRWADGI